MTTLRVDWTDRLSVLRFAQSRADKAATDLVVIRHQGQEAFSITHLSRDDRWTQPTVVYRRIVRARRAK